MSAPGPETAVPVRVRVAPSPTGDPHVGTAYQALVNLAFARSRGGVFVLRIEDTDRARSSRESEAAILDALRWLGLDWDEGPYRQSERLELYRSEVDRLLADGSAYRCFCTRERLDEMRRENRAQQRFPGYDRRCRDLPVAESERRAAAGEPHTIRLAMPTEGECVMRDLLRGEIRREWELIDDQVILKADGYPTYHLACVVDDHAMGISHVIRGEEWINSLPKHLRLFEALGYEPPVFCHLPLLRNNDANRSKLSKRRNPTSITWFRDAGFLPGALLNFLGLMVSSRAEGEEKFSLDQLVDGFRLEDISLGGPVFDLDKLRWLNARYLREDYDADGLADLVRDWSMGQERLAAIAALAQPRLETLGDWGRLTSFLFVDAPDVEPEKPGVRGLEEAVKALKERVSDLEQALKGGVPGVEEAVKAFEGGVPGVEEAVKALKGGVPGVEEAVKALKRGVSGVEEGIKALKGKGLKEGVKDLEEAQVAEALQFMLWTLEREQTFTADVIQDHFRRLSEALGVSLRDLTRPFYVAMSGETASLPLFDSMEILGPDLVRARVRHAIEALGGISGKRMKKLQKRFEGLGE
ncbi:MAG: glutamate--tRNA ligase [Acidobacteriota bacterium]|nr:glutamate--tRNA ligase [Acidobacteriota bacterium]